MGFCPHHCPSPGRGSGAFVLVAVGAFVVIGTQEAAIARTARVALDVALITVASLVALAVTAVLAWASVRVYRWRAARVLLAAESPAELAAAVKALPAGRLAIEAPPPVTVTLSASDYAERTHHVGLEREQRVL